MKKKTSDMQTSLLNFVIIWAAVFAMKSSSFVVLL